MFDVIVVGAGPAGLSAALILGRCRRQVLVCDTRRPRNAASHGLHGFLTRDGILPHDLLRIAREQLGPYASVLVCVVEVVDAHLADGGFDVTLADGTRHRCRRLLLATGVVDDVPAVEGLQSLYGKSVFHCPYCDGWEVRDQPLAVLGRPDYAYGLSLDLLLWSRDVILCTDGQPPPSPHHRQRLERHDIAVRDEPIARLQGTHGQLERIVFATGDSLERRAIFLATGQRQHSDLPARLGCEFNDEGTVRTDAHEASNVPGLYVAGDASRRVQFAIVAAAEGARAAEAINRSLLAEDLD